MATVSLKKVSDNTPVEIDLGRFYDAIQNKQADRVNDIIRICDESFILSSMSHNASYAPSVNDVKIFKEDENLSLKYYNGTEWVTTGITWDI